MALLALGVITVLFGAMAVVARTTERRELRRRYDEAIAAAAVEAETWEADLLDPAEHPLGV